IAVMWLTPAQDRLFTGPAGDRRKFLDRFALTHNPNHGITSIRYEKTRSERNRLLSDGIQDAAWYDALETDLAKHGAQITQARVETVARLQEAINTRDSVFPKSHLQLEGYMETLLEDAKDFEDLEFTFREHLSATRAVDMRAGRTLIGPHRSELSVTHIAKSMPAAQCSTGEQKALLIGLILAHARAQAHKQPILLLDEVVAHLDAERRAALAEELFDLGTQIFMTGTDVELFSDFVGRAQIKDINDMLEK
ncbi:MAG: DNA replication and repair protein RecF, partial [Litorimonas sp.]